MKKMRATVMLLLAVFLLVGCTAGGNKKGTTGNQAGGGKGQTITFGVTPWSSTIPPTKVAEQILQSMGYKTKEIKADAGGVYAGLYRGDIDVFMDAWLPDMHRKYMKKFGKNITDTAVSYPNAELGWVVPTYVKNINSVADIKGKEGMFNNKIYGIEEGAGMTDTSKKMIKAYGLNLQYVASSEGGMLAQASKLIKAKKPVLFLGWRPHPMFVKYDLKVLKDSKGYFKASQVHVLTNKKFKDKAPKAFDMLKKWHIKIDDVEKMIVENNSGKDPNQVAKEWIKNHQDQVNQMKSAAK